MFQKTSREALDACRKWENKEQGEEREAKGKQGQAEDSELYLEDRPKLTTETEDSIRAGWVRGTYKSAKRAAFKYTEKPEKPPFLCGMSIASKGFRTEEEEEKGHRRFQGGKDRHTVGCNFQHYRRKSVSERKVPWRSNKTPNKQINWEQDKASLQRQILSL